MAASVQTQEGFGSRAGSTLVRRMEKSRLAVMTEPGAAEPTTPQLWVSGSG